MDEKYSYPLPVLGRGVFFNNKTAFKVSGFIAHGEFAINAWIKSHDAGYASIFSTNHPSATSKDEIQSFSWRVANFAKTDQKRDNMVEIRNWIDSHTRFRATAVDPGYKPKHWSNIALSVDYDWEYEISTI